MIEHFQVQVLILNTMNGKIYYKEFKNTVHHKFYTFRKVKYY